MGKATMVGGKVVDVAVVAGTVVGSPEKILTIMPCHVEFNVIQVRVQ